MEPSQYKYMFEVEDRHWWYVGNHEIFLNTLQRHGLLKDGQQVLDAGCGTGKWLEIIKHAYDLKETGIDYQQLAINYAKTRGKLNLALGDINKCDFKESSFDLITSFDVICNTNIDDRLAIRNFNTWLKQDGALMVTVPAYQFLLGKHDNQVHQNKRYRRKQVRTLLEKNGFTIVKLSYCVSILFPIALIKRALDNAASLKNNEHNEVKMPPGIINRLFLMVMRIEQFMLRYISLPFGLSVMVVAKKNHPAYSIKESHIHEA